MVNKPAQFSPEKNPTARDIHGQTIAVEAAYGMRDACATHARRMPDQVRPGHRRLVPVAFAGVSLSPGESWATLAASRGPMNGTSTK